MTRGILTGTLFGLMLTGAALGQDASSWSSAPVKAPNERGETRLLKQDGQRTAPQRSAPAAGPAIPGSVTGSTPRFSAPGSAPASGTGALGATTIPKTSGGSDPAYDAFDQGRYLTAFDLASKAAEAGDPQAHTLVGRLHQEGLGVPRDPVLAAQWYRRAAELGDIEGTFAFAVMLAEGDGIQRNRPGAADLFEQAAAKGHALANYNLALLFLRGDGKPENAMRGALHLRFAAERGIAQAQYDLATLYATGTGVDADAAEAAGWMERAADQGHVEAQLEFGVWLFQGRGVLPSQSRGLLYLRQAAERGNAVAQNRVARAYAFGAGAPADSDVAARWHLIARANGVADQTLDELVAKLPRDRRAAVEAAATTWREQSLMQ